MADPIQSTGALVFTIGAGIVAGLVAWRPRQTLRRIFGRHSLASAPERTIQFEQAMGALVAVGIVLMLLEHFFPQWSTW